jgi:predicted AlkP superfamily pyrophosphatase or phosphodiesterase
MSMKAITHTNSLAVLTRVAAFTVTTFGIFATFLSMTACHQIDDQPPGRVLIVGIDGANLRMIDPLIDQGRLPHLAKIRSQGISGPLESIMPLESPRIWNSIATGKAPEKHGIISFAYAARQGVQHLYLSSDRKVHALWNIVSNAGLSVSVINWWNTFPPEKINGVMISDHLQNREITLRETLTNATETPSGGLTFPESWQERLAVLIETDDPAVQFADPFLETQQLVYGRQHNQRLSKYFQEDGEVLRFALEVESAEHPDVMLVFLPGIDRVSHFLWGMIERAELYPEKMRPGPELQGAGQKAFEAYYEFTDAMLGKLIERYAKDDLIVVLSDHGFEPGNEFGLLTGVHKTSKAIDGIIFARGRGLPMNTDAGEVSVLDITPTILAWLGLPVGEDMDGQIAAFLGDFLGGKPVARIPTHDTRPIERLEFSTSGADQKILENLRALGYLEEE